MKVLFRLILLIPPLACLPVQSAAAADAASPNIVLITVDDMNFDTPGAFGGRVDGITPRIDRLAAQGRRFLHAHVPVAVCQPSRQCIMTGTYPQTNGSTGFYPLNPQSTTLVEVLKAHGYHLGILGKVLHLRPAEKFPWDMQHDQHELGAGRDPERYHALATKFFEQAKSAGKPFFLMANSHDPHRPFAGAAGEQQQLLNQVGPTAKGLSEQVRDAGEVPVELAEHPAPRRVYQPDEVTVPGFLPDLPDVRKEVAQYYSSAHRADEMVGRILDALEASGLADNSIVIFLSDNGIALPFAKSNCYLASTRTPLIIRWPGTTQPGSVDSTHFVSGVDLMPTLLEALKLPLPKGMDGRSFLPLLSGQAHDHRTQAFSSYEETSARVGYPMRCVQSARFGYIYNAWSDGEKAYRAESMIGLTYPAMASAAKDDSAIAARVEMFLHRVPEEFYDLQNDPDALRNLIDEPRYQEEIQQYRTDLLAWMQRTKDPLAATFAATMENATPSASRTPSSP